uniref:Orphan protein n=1 Tax=Rheinheimera sp. BAL341 TaxID=1708203 RepID=A0A486XRW5_9GAMM
MKHRVSIFLIALLFSSVAISDDLGDCQKIFALSQSALSNKAKGISKDRLVLALPTKQAEEEPEPLHSMREIVEEVYSYQITNQFAYSVYRTERCVLREAGQLKPVEFGDIFVELNSCSNEAPECAMKLAGSKP